MFRCESCHAVVPPGTPASRVVVETREKDYESRKKVNEVPNWPKSVSSDGKFPRNNRSVGSTVKQRPRPQWRSVDDFGGRGTEIVREQQVCPGCRGQHLLH